MSLVGKTLTGRIEQVNRSIVSIFVGDEVTQNSYTDTSRASISIFFESLINNASTANYAVDVTITANGATNTIKGLMSATKCEMNLSFNLYQDLNIVAPDPIPEVINKVNIFGEVTLKKKKKHWNANGIMFANRSGLEVIVVTLDLAINSQIVDGYLTFDD